jgi:hypothetical protein
MIPMMAISLNIRLVFPAKLALIKSSHFKPIDFLPFVFGNFGSLNIFYLILFISPAFDFTSKESEEYC